ncbi:NUDIX domain-containing protein [Allonocardiopsis opalescens]|uniref:ADP-ribose pyrophosphatase YjhB (NUDIX family) n=1 Tax=Allonocardiopsis opalescens TaxID=1144618 RepID=A0A2T0PTP5_9ACTN|nr:NUDIX hydrolase [Allonocardiopsis opalescens]PRX92270.1 ADP-ribose pyrophosphatase YjhB (NUDIX family) [Allonocardiopsis opalescens]
MCADRAFFDSLPRRRGAASALLLDGAGRLLVVRPSYRPGWGLPGGVIEAGESPLGAVRRECAEELGFVPALDGLLCVDFLPPDPAIAPDGREALVFTFTGRLEAGAFEAIRLPPDELVAAEMVDPAAADRYLPAPAARRVAACLAALADGRPGALYLEYGRPVQW